MELVTIQLAALLATVLTLTLDRLVAQVGVCLCLVAVIRTSSKITRNTSSRNSDHHLTSVVLEPVFCKGDMVADEKMKVKRVANFYIS